MRPSRKHGAPMRADAAPPPLSRPAPRALVVTLAVGFALRTVATFVPSAHLWGLDTLRAWPLPLALGLVGLGAAGFVPPFVGWLERVLDGLGAKWQRAGMWV